MRSMRMLEVLASGAGMAKSSTWRRNSNTVAIYRAGVKAWFVDSRRETKAMEYFVGVFFPKSW